MDFYLRFVIVFLGVALVALGIWGLGGVLSKKIRPAWFYGTMFGGILTAGVYLFFG